MKLFTMAVMLAFASGTVVAIAAERSISQKGKVFSEAEVTLKRGDTIVFVNDDVVAHNIISTSVGNEFNLGSQAPGVSTPVTLRKAGEVIVLCAMHPRMKMVVTVTE